MSESRLLKRGGVYYYRRRVPKALVEKIGRRFVQYSLRTSNVGEAKKLRPFEDIKTDAMFAAASASRRDEASSSYSSISPEATQRLVRDYVETHQRRFIDLLTTQPVETPAEIDELKQEAQETISILKNPLDPRRDEWISAAAEKIIGRFRPADDTLELVWRALLEVARRKAAFLEADFSKAFFDRAFGPGERQAATFGEICEQYFDEKTEDARINGISRKRIDAIAARLALLKEIIGESTPAQNVDYTATQRVRSCLAQTPINRIKLYRGQSLQKSIESAARAQAALLSPTTQGQYLETFRNVLELARRKGLLLQNPAAGIRPLKRDAMPDVQKRSPFSLDQLASFFGSAFYKSCVPGTLHPYLKPDRDWRFWLPLLCLFMGLRPNEACQLLIDDINRTNGGTWYIDISETNGEGETPRKTLKTFTSRRRVPIHPELLKIGFIHFVQDRGGSGRLFPSLKPDKYGNLATYALRRFREEFLPDAISVEARQTFYSFRHSFRDALRRLDVQPATLRALGGWGEGKAEVSDAYGDPYDPDYQIAHLSKVSFPPLDLNFLYGAY